MKSNLLAQIGTGPTKYIKKYVDLDSPNTLLVYTTNPFNIESNNASINALINLNPVNEFRYINKFFNAVNAKLSQEGIFICRFETIVARKERQKLGNIPYIRNLYFILEFLFLRVSPKIWGIKKIFFLITRGKIRLLSKAEVLGRLVSCGFKIVDYKTLNGYLYCVVKKEKLPDFNPEASYGLLFKMKRMGKNGKIIKVYKLRTMHPYSEYLQDHILTLNGYAETGKPKNDFRLTPWGGFLRKFWIDELPQLINVIKGEMKLVGVRPISQRYFNDIPKDLQELRLKHKPGCIPPYVALDRKGSVEEVLQSEREYLLTKSKHPYTTDTKFFFKALFNIIVKRKRSA
jgi:lipopolysaccharide/colanic/teichoic acid biosynthesis glycosyltransferase